MGEESLAAVPFDRAVEQVLFWFSLLFLRNDAILVHLKSHLWFQTWLAITDANFLLDSVLESRVLSVVWINQLLPPFFTKWGALGKGCWGFITGHCAALFLKFITFLLVPSCGFFENCAQL